MTYTQAPSDLFVRILSYVRRVGAMIARGGFALFVVFAAGAALVATTVVGLFIALAAVCLNLAHRVMGRTQRSSFSAKPNMRYSWGGKPAGARNKKVITIAHSR